MTNRLYIIIKKKFLTTGIKMGLGMFLIGRVYTWYNNANNFQVLLNLFPKLSKFKFYSIDILLGYWSNAYGIHGWFLENTEYNNGYKRIILREYLKKLLHKCKEVKQDKSKMEELFPLPENYKSCYEYYKMEEWFLKDIEDTIRIIKNIFSNLPKEWDMYYRWS